MVVQQNALHTVDEQFYITHFPISPWANLLSVLTCALSPLSMRLAARSQAVCVCVFMCVCVYVCVYVCVCLCVCVYVCVLCVLCVCMCVDTNWH